MSKSRLNKKTIYKKIQEKFKSIWHQELFNDKSDQEHGNKLRTYRLFKQNFNFEKYLLWGDYQKRKILTKFRISAHDLEIERGRYKGIKADQRFCELCHNDVEDELHFLLICPLLNNTRKPFLNAISSNYKNFDNLDVNQKFLWLLSSEDHFIFNQLYALLSNLYFDKTRLLAGEASQVHH